MSLTSKVATAFVSGAIAIGMSVAVSAADPITERQAAMKDVGSSIGTLAKMLQGKMAFDAAAANAAAATIADRFTKAKPLFPEGSDKGAKETWAKAEIWQDKAGFDKIMDDGIAAANAMTSLASVDDIKAKIGPLGASCKSCHEKFRRPKE